MVSEDLLLKLESVCEKYIYKISVIINIRGTHTTIKFRSYIECGRQGRIITVTRPPRLKNFLEKIHDIGEFNAIFSKVCVEVVLNMTSIPE